MTRDPFTAAVVLATGAVVWALVALAIGVGVIATRALRRNP